MSKSGSDRCRSRAFMEKIIAAIVTYNRRELLSEALNALTSQKQLSEILVIDNASTDGTELMLAPLIERSQIRYINTGKNLGGAGGFSLALEEGVKAGADYIWIMDDDTIVTEHALDALLDQVRAHPEAAFFSSEALWTDGTPNKMNTHRLLEPEDGKQAVLCREATFVSLLVRKESVIRNGLPVREFFIWGDDIEYTRRLSFRESGYYVPGSIVVHKTKTNEGSNIVTDDPARLARYRYAYRNEIYIAREEGAIRWLRQFAKILYHSGKVLFLSKERKMEKIRLIWASSAEGLSFNPPIRYVSDSAETNRPDHLKAETGFEIRK